MAKKTKYGYGGYIGHLSKETQDFIEDIENANQVYVGNIHDTAFDEIKKRLIEKKGLEEKEAEEQAGRILSATKGKKEEAKKEKTKLEQLELINQRYRDQISYFDLPSLEKAIELLKKDSHVNIPKKVEKLIKKYEEYNKLIKQLPPLKLSKNTPSQKKFEELRKQASEVKFFRGREMEGVNISQQAQKDRLKQEAQQYCAHEFKIKYDAGYTADARKRVTRIAKCEKCGKKYMHKAEEKLSREAMWR